MKTSLLVASVLLALAGQAHAASAPAYTPIRITAPNGGFVAAIGVTPSAVPAAPVAVPPSTKTTAPASKDSAAIADLKRAEANFKNAKTTPAAKPAPTKLADAPSEMSAAPAPATAAAPAAATAPAQAAPVAAKAVAPKAAPAAAVAPKSVAVVPTAAKPVVVAPARPSAVILSDRSANAQLPSLSRGGKVTATAQMDAAGLLTARCASLGKHTMKCMNLELARAENDVDTTETRLLNCREIRKFDKSLDAQAVDGFVTSHMYQMRLKATQAFNAEIAEAGQASRLKTREIELRATISHLNKVTSFTAKVCSAQAFSAMYAQAAAAQAK